jgi:hypothetical protein
MAANPCKRAQQMRLDPFRAVARERCLRLRSALSRAGPAASAFGGFIASGERHCEHAVLANREAGPKGERRRRESKKRTGEERFPDHS